MQPTPNQTNVSCIPSFRRPLCKNAVLKSLNIVMLLEDTTGSPYTCDMLVLVFSVNNDHGKIQESVKWGQVKLIFISPPTSLTSVTVPLFAHSERIESGM